MLFGVEAHCAQEVMSAQRITRVPLAPGVVDGMINLRGQIVTAINMRRPLGLQDLSQNPSMYVVVQTATGVFCLVVDAIGDVLTVPESSFEASPHTLDDNARRLIGGAYKLDDGLLLFLDVDRATYLPTYRLNWSQEFIWEDLSVSGDEPI